MKNFFSNTFEAVDLINQISEFDYAGMRVIICMLIDTASAKHHMPIEEVLDNICSTVKAVNAELGAYNI